MKTGIHPEYKPDTVTCACGAIYETMSTKNNIRVEICASCHPLFTGKEKYIDTAGRIDRFKKKYTRKDKEKKKDV